MTTTIASDNTPRSGLAGVPRAIWIGGGLMGLTIIALATTLVVRGNDAPADATPAPVVATTATPGAPTTESSSVAQAPAPVVVAPAARHEAARSTHHSTTPVHEATRQEGAEPQQVASVPPCTTCGVVESYSAVQVKGQNNGVGAVAGGVGGALIGSKIAGRGNHTLGGALGAIGGGLLGNAIESHERTSTAYDVHVRMNDGTLRTVRQAAVPTVGAKVTVEGNALHTVSAQG